MLVRAIARHRRPATEIVEAYVPRHHLSVLSAGVWEWSFAKIQQLSSRPTSPTLQASAKYHNPLCHTRLGSRK